MGFAALRSDTHRQMTTVAKSATASFYGGCVWETFGSAGLTLLRSANPHTAATHLFRSRKVALPDPLKSATYDDQNTAPPLRPHVPPRHRPPRSPHRRQRTTTRPPRLRRRTPQRRPQVPRPHRLHPPPRSCRA